MSYLTTVRQAMQQARAAWYEHLPPSGGHPDEPEADEAWRSWAQREEQLKLNYRKLQGDFIDAVEGALDRGLLIERRA